MSKQKELLMTMVRALAEDSKKSIKVAEKAFHKQLAPRVHKIVEEREEDFEVNFDMDDGAGDLDADNAMVADDEFAAGDEEACCKCVNCGAEVDTPFCGECGTQNEEYQEEAGEFEDEFSDEVDLEDESDLGAEVPGEEDKFQ